MNSTKSQYLSPFGGKDTTGPAVKYLKQLGRNGIYKLISNSTLPMRQKHKPEEYDSMENHLGYPHNRLKHVQLCWLTRLASETSPNVPEASRGSENPPNMLGK